MAEVRKEYIFCYDIQRLGSQFFVTDIRQNNPFLFHRDRIEIKANGIACEEVLKEAKEKFYEIKQNQSLYDRYGLDYLSDLEILYEIIKDKEQNIKFIRSKVRPINSSNEKGKRVNYHDDTRQHYRKAI